MNFISKFALTFEWLSLLRLKYRTEWRKTAARFLRKDCGKLRNQEGKVCAHAFDRCRKSGRCF